MGKDVAAPDSGGTAGPDFERELRDIVLTTSADGTGVSGDWTISTVPDRIPDWRVRIERRDEDEAARSSAPSMD